MIGCDDTPTTERTPSGLERHRAQHFSNCQRVRWLDTGRPEQAQQPVRAEFEPGWTEECVQEDQVHGYGEERGGEPEEEALGEDRQHIPAVRPGREAVGAGGRRLDNDASRSIP